ncbi:MAG: hypothetical protein WAM75_00980, partial [Xanthobacteraceae bacterium]
MSFAWLSWSNPVAVWWGFLLAVSAINIALLFGLRACYRANPFGARDCAFAFEPLAALECGLRARLRLPLDPAARRRAADLSVRYLAVERTD